MSASSVSRPRGCPGAAKFSRTALQSSKAAPPKWYTRSAAARAESDRAARGTRHAAGHAAGCAATSFHWRHARKKFRFA
eukprot:3144667-Alexandrium_andersonii.AAC.1